MAKLIPRGFHIRPKTLYNAALMESCNNLIKTDTNPNLKHDSIWMTRLLTPSTNSD